MKLLGKKKAVVKEPCTTKDACCESEDNYSRPKFKVIVTLGKECYDNTIQRYLLINPITNRPMAIESNNAEFHDVEYIYKFYDKLEDGQFESVTAKLQLK